MSYFQCWLNVVHICDLHGTVYNMGGGEITTPSLFLPSYSLCMPSPYVGGKCTVDGPRGSVAELDSHTKSGRVWLHKTILRGPCTVVCNIVW